MSRFDDVLLSQLERISTAITKLESRLDAVDRQASEIQAPMSSYQPNSFPLQHHHWDRHQPQPTLLYQQRHPPVGHTGFHPPHAQPPDPSDPLEWQQMYHNQQLYYNQNLATSTSGQPQPDLAMPFGSQSLNQPVIHPPRPPQWGTSTFSLPSALQPLHNLLEQHIPCEFLAYDQQTTAAWPLHTTLEQLTCRDQPTQRQPLGFQECDQPLAHQPSCWEPPLTATVAANQLYQNYQPPPPMSRSDSPPQQSSPALPNVVFGPPLYDASNT